MPRKRSSLLPLMNVPEQAPPSRWTPFSKMKRRKRNYGGTETTHNDPNGGIGGGGPTAVPLTPNSPHKLSNRLLEIVDPAAEPPREDDDDVDLISTFEFVLRMILFGSFLVWIGTIFPTQTSKAARALEYSFVAWGTIIVLRLAISYRDQCIWRTRDAQFEAEIDQERKALLDDDDEDELIDDPEDGQDPSLSALYIVNTSTRQRAVYNDAESTLALETDYFSGKMLIFIREPNGGPAYFYGKQRRFEFQFQVVLKKVPGRIRVLWHESAEPPQARVDATHVGQCRHGLLSEFEFGFNLLIVQ